MQAVYRQQEKLRLYRSLLKGACRYPLASHRQMVYMEVRSSFRDPQNDSLGNEEVDHKLTLGWERSAAIAQYASNMHWFHSRDEVNKDMLNYSRGRDQQRINDMERANNVCRANIKTDEVTNFKSVLYHYHPNYYEKIEKTPLHNPRDMWRARGTNGSDIGGSKQRFYIRRFRPVFPQGW